MSINNSPPPVLEGMILPRKVSMKSRTVRGVVGSVSQAVALLTPYAMYQAAAHDTLSPEILDAIGNKMVAGGLDTLQDVETVLLSIIDNFHSLKSWLFYEILGSIDHPTFSNPIIEALGGQPDPSYDDLNDSMRLVRQLSGAVEIEAASAWNNMLNSSLETFSAMGGVWASSWIGRKIANTLILKDNPTFGQRMRFKFFNFFRKKEGSRKIDIPQRGDGIFRRK